MRAGITISVWESMLKYVIVVSGQIGDEEYV